MRIEVNPIVTKRDDSDYQDKSLLDAFFATTAPSRLLRKEKVCNSSITWLPQRRRKGLIENFIEVIKPQFTDKNEFETRNKSIKIAFFEFLDNQRFEARIKTEKFVVRWSYMKRENPTTTR